MNIPHARAKEGQERQRAHGASAERAERQVLCDKPLLDQSDEDRREGRVQGKCAVYGG